MSGISSEKVLWPKSMKTILKKYWNLQKENGEILYDNEKQAFAEEMIQAYNSAKVDEKKDVLVPRSGKYLLSKPINRKVGGDGKEIFSIYYDFPPEDGFLDGISQRIVMKVGEKYDRIGDEFGHFLSRVLPTGPQSVESRSLPYYISETDFTKNPAYHIYEVKKEFKGIAPLCKINNAYAVRRGTVAPAFEKEGLGEQTVIPKRDLNGDDFHIRALKDGGFLNE